MIFDCFNLFHTQLILSIFSVSKSKLNNRDGMMMTGQGSVIKGKELKQTTKSYFLDRDGFQE